MKKFLNKPSAIIESIFKSRFSTFTFSIVAGAIGVIPYYVESLFILTFISFLFQFYIVIAVRKQKRKVFINYFAYFWGFYTPLYSFLSELYPYSRFGFTSTQAIFIVICSCIFIPLIHALVEAFILSLTDFFKEGYQETLATASLWVIGEWVLTLGTLAFPWSNVAVSMTGFLPYLQTASIFGKSFITFITVSGCYCFAKFIHNREKLYAIIGASVILINSLAGTVLYIIPQNETDSVTAATIQGNVLSNEKWDSSNQGSIFDRYMELTEDAARNGAEIIVIPESAIPLYFYENGTLHKAFSLITQKYNVTIISGISSRSDEGVYNSVIAVFPDGSVSERYDKRHLVPFGEFMPFADILGQLVPFVGEFNESSSDYLEGDQAVIINTEHGDITPLVCFDSIFPAFSSDGCKEGANYIALVTNDSWFNDSSGIYTHLRHSQLRAIENRRYVMRAANTGVSAFIDIKGRIISSSEPLTVDTVVSEIHPNDKISIYAKIGDIFVPISFIIILIFTTISFLRRMKNGNNPASSDRDL